VNTEKVMACSRKVQAFLGRTLPSHVLQAGTRDQLFEKISAGIS